MLFVTSSPWQCSAVAWLAYVTDGTSLHVKMFHADCIQALRFYFRRFPESGLRYVPPREENCKLCCGLLSQRLHAIYKKTVVAFLAEVCKTFDLAYFWSESRQTGIWIDVLTNGQRNQEHTTWFWPLSIDEHCEKQSSKKGDHSAFAVVEDCNTICGPISGLHSFIVSRYHAIVRWLVLNYPVSDV